MTTKKELYDIHWTGIYTFFVVTKFLSMKKTAALFGLKLPTVSQRISTLERHLGITLFKRNTNSIELTAAGRELYTGIEPMFGEHAMNVIACLKKMQGEGAENVT